ncbi:ribosome recycling factor [Candidatus Daviesbacteria bacterium RIFCSPHIGHO2_02_FULL_36_13]|uniref:Ribosome-recycling factor n=1 Tax=Candidatus Daviesbacteria bacterium RIFCSPHIGHO2_02_FULL_36_13 TaxID=1797768 RepID=A0A1F5JS19_9BACT|nr:MAG: ribosome recycling factor [Candidatus Daviesbacteria bacterium RIFCSPHIGHO2_02_FULL_36_13]
MDPVLTAANEKIDAALHHFKVEIAGIRAGRANPALIENIPVEAYGGRMKLMEVGNISAPQPTLLTVQLWDASILQTVLKAIQDANLGLNPSNDGSLIRLPIPSLTAERREEFIKILHTKMEDGKVAIRNIRQEFRNEWKKDSDNGIISEDEFGRREKLLQVMIDKKIIEIDELGKAKTEELTQI